MSEFFQSCMEEMYYITDTMGMVGSPVDSYNALLCLSSLAMLSPVFVMVYLYLIWFCLQMVSRKKQAQNLRKNTVEHDPDFEPEDTPFE